jgi:hypothetical protein
MAPGLSCGAGADLAGAHRVETAFGEQAGGDRQQAQARLGLLGRKGFARRHGARFWHQSSACLLNKEKMARGAPER